MLAKLKRILPEPIKQLYVGGRLALKWSYELLRRILKRPLNLVFFSPTKALKAACRPPASLNTVVTLKTRSGEVRLQSGISIYENVISYPLAQAGNENRLGDYFLGGLANPTSQTLIHEAIHYNGVAYTQSLPTTYIETYSLENCLEIREPILYGGIMFAHFGHFVSESLCRLYAYPMVREIDPFVLFYAPWDLPRYLEKNNFANQILTGFGIPPERLIFVNQVAKIREIIIPAQKYGFGFIHRPDDIFVEFARSFRFEHKVPKGWEEAERIYVSRSSLRKQGGQVGEKIFERYLAAEGYKIFYPEQHTFFEQLTVYASAKKVIFSEGSAILSCILLPDLQAEVAVVCRRRDPRRNIRVATDCLQGYGKRILWIDAVRGQYQFGLDTWDALADIDWYEVSQLLRKHGYVDKPFQMLTDEDHLALVKSELREYLQEIYGNPKFVDQMMKLNETYPLWIGPSHLVDPRDGLPIWPSENPQ